MHHRRDIRVKGSSGNVSVLFAEGEPLRNAGVSIYFLYQMLIILWELEYSGRYPRLSRGRTVFNPPIGRLLFFPYFFFFSAELYDTTIIHTLAVLVVL